MNKSVKKTVKKRVPSQKKTVEKVIESAPVQQELPALQTTSLIPFDQLKGMAQALGANKLFGKTPEELLPLMLIAQAEGMHPAIAAQEYDIIQGKPAINSRAALARFQRSGGKIGWKTRTDKEATAIFEHPSCIGTVEITWTIERAVKAGLTGKDNWRKYPAQMLASRVVAEGVRACAPGCLSLMYTIEEVQDFTNVPTQGEQRNITPAFTEEAYKRTDKEDLEIMRGKTSPGFQGRNEVSNEPKNVTIGDDRGISDAFDSPLFKGGEVIDQVATDNLKAYVESLDWQGKAVEYQAVQKTIREGVSVAHAENIRGRIDALNLKEAVF